MSTPLSDEIARNLVAELGPDAHPARLMSISSEDVTGMLDIVEGTDAIFFGIHECARARIHAGKICTLAVEPHVERTGRYALVRLAGRSESPAMQVFSEFARAHFCG
jgi:DNA-binding transcriptional LysR family regulator